MAQLDRWNYEVTLFPEVKVQDRDGNIRSTCSDIGVPLKVWLEPRMQSGTSSRRAEQDNEGYESEQVMRMRLLRKDLGLTIGAQAQIEFEGQRWSVFGDAFKYYGSPRTRHDDYTLRRA